MIITAYIESLPIFINAKLSFRASNPLVNSEKELQWSCKLQHNLSDLKTCRVFFFFKKKTFQRTGQEVFTCITFCQESHTFVRYVTTGKFSHVPSHSILMKLKGQILLAALQVQQHSFREPWGFFQGHTSSPHCVVCFCSTMTHKIDCYKKMNSNSSHLKISLISFCYLLSCLQWRGRRFYYLKCHAIALHKYNPSISKWSLGNGSIQSFLLWSLSIFSYFFVS